MKKRVMLFLLVPVFICFVLTPSQADLTSTFDTNAEGWTTYATFDPTLVAPIAWSDSGGNPGGFVSATDIALVNIMSAWYFMAPNSWNGDWSAYVGGSIEWDQKITASWETLPLLNRRASLIIDAPGEGTGMAWASTPFTITQLGDWMHFKADLLPSSFGVRGGTTFVDIMSNVTGVYILGEFSDGPDSSGIDNVRVSPVPGPATMWLLASGLLGLAGLRRKFKK